MTEFIVGMGFALWLGVLTSISPCPLATNIAAISYIGRKVGNSRQLFLTGLLYTLGRTLAYVVLAFVLVASGHGLIEVSTPSHKADPIPTMNSVMIRPLPV